MKYDFEKDYKKHVFDTPIKMDQENAVASKIMCLLNNNKYDNIYDFAAKNPTYQDFLKNNNFENAIKHFGNTLNEADYHKIVDEIVKITEKKKSFEKESIKTINIAEEQFVTHTGADKTTFLDNTHTKNNLSIERQLEELQPTQRDFQTINEKTNTDPGIVRPVCCAGTDCRGSGHLAGLGIRGRCAGSAEGAGGGA